MNPTQVGDHIGSYLLTKQIGKGGMAMIFEAKHMERQKNYAIKIMLPTQKQEEVSHRFHQEYKALSRLKHPNVLRVLESGIHEEKPYFVCPAVGTTVCHPPRRATQIRSLTQTRKNATRVYSTVPA